MPEQIHDEGTAELRAQVRRLQHELDGLNAQINGRDRPVDDGGNPPPLTEERTGRRGLLKAAGAAALGATAASLFEASPVGATEDSAVLAGETNTATSETVISTSSGNALSGQTGDDTAAGLYGVGVASSGATAGLSPAGVLGDSNTGIGVAGVSSVNSGVYGLTTGNPEAGVLGADASGDVSSYGVYGTSVNGYGVVAHSSGVAPLLVLPSDTAGAPTTGTHQLGELYVDSNGVFYRCVVAGSPGTWVPQYSTVPLAAPVRVVDTTDGTGGLTGPFDANGETHTTGVLTGGSTGIPETAVALVANLTISGNGVTLNGDGYLTLFPAGTTNPGTSSLNAGGSAFATSNGVTIALGSGAPVLDGRLSFSWQGGGSPVPCQVFLDATAYIL